MDDHNIEHHEHFKDDSIKRNSKFYKFFNDIRAEVEI